MEELDQVGWRPLVAVAAALIVVFGALIVFGGVDEQTPSQNDILDRVNSSDAEDRLNCRPVGEYDVIHVLRTDQPVPGENAAIALLERACRDNVRVSDAECENIATHTVVRFETGDDIIKAAYPNTTYAYPFQSRNDTLAATADGDVYLVPQCGRLP